VASIVRSGSTVFHLSSSAPPRLCANQATFRSALSSLRFLPRHTSSLITLIFHSVQILLNKPRRAYIFATFHSAILLMELNSLQFRWPSFFVALPRSTNGGSVSTGWILPRGRDDLRVVRLSALTLISSDGSAPSLAGSQRFNSKRASRKLIEYLAQSL